MALICANPKRDRGLRRIDENTAVPSCGVVKGSRISIQDRFITIFSLTDDPAVHNELKRRVKAYNKYEDTPIEVHSLVKDYDLNMRPVASMTLVISIILLILEGQYAISTVVAKLAMSRYSALCKTVLERLECLSERKWSKQSAK